jgi:hypothetical protein
MHISFSAHNAKSNSSSSNLIEYLDKENQIENNLNEVKSYESFFNTDYDSINSNQNLNTNYIINELDNNRGSQKLDSSNFYMINISPSQDEMNLMEKLAKEELEKRGIDETKNEASKIFYNEQKNELMKMQMKLYTQNVMVEYANNFNREIYCNEDKLPNDSEKEILKTESEKKFNEYLNEKNIFIPTKKESIPNESKEWIKTNNIKEIESKGKSLLIEIDLEEKGKAQVNIPKSALHLQEDKSYKLPKNLYDEKVKEVLAKNTLKEINFNQVETRTVNINNKSEKVYNFQFDDKRFKEPLTYSVNEKDVKMNNGRYFISEHLLKEKESYALKKGIEKEFNQEKEKIYSDLAKSKGFDLSKRPLTEKDLLWYGKIESCRNYKHTDKLVKENKQILAEIRNWKKEIVGSRFGEIEKLEKQLHRDKYTNEIIKEGNVKGGNQYHAHVVVSRHDKTMQNPRNKISLSPLANAVDGNMQNGAKVGFNRKEFAQKAEKVFDAKFEYDRPKEKSFEAYNTKTIKQKNSKEQIKSKGQNEVKQFLMKHSGLNQIKSNISPVQSIKKEIGVANIPTSLPKSVTDIAIKVAKKIIAKGIEY